MPRGGRRIGSGRKPDGYIEKTVSLSPKMWDKIDDYALKNGISVRSEAIRQIFESFFKNN